MAAAAVTLEDPKWETVLRPRQVEVAKVLYPLRNRLPSWLYSKNLISGDEEERFTKSTKGDTDLALEILQVLRKQGPGSFDKFCDVLLAIDNETLRELERSFRPESSSRDSRSEQKLDRKSVQIVVLESLFEDFEKKKCGEQLKDALFHAFGIPKESITSYPVTRPFCRSESKSVHVVHVSDTALITVVVSGVDKAEVKKHGNMIINFLSLETEVKESEIQLVQILPCNSCLLVIRLPGLAMVRLIIAFFGSKTRQEFCKRFANYLPKSAVELTFGFASLPNSTASLSSIPKFGDNLSHLTEHEQEGNFSNVIKEAASPEALALVAKYAQNFLDGVIKLTESVDKTRHAWADAKTTANYSWNAVYTAVEWALDFINVVEQFASWGHSSDRIERVKSALKAGDFEAIDSFMLTLNIHMEQTSERFKLFQKIADKATEETYSAAKDVEKEATKANSRKRIVRVVGGTASSLLLAGGVTATVLTVLFPPAGIPLLVGAAVGTGIAATGGVATAVGTGIAAANIEKAAKQMTELALMLNDLSTTASCVLANVEEVMTWLQQCLNTMAVTRTSYDHAKKSYTPDVDAVERFRMESQTLHSAASAAGGVLTKLKQDLMSHMHVSPRASSDKE